ncbi:hypothetical protein SKAU_G00079670 [Synaphobranchus kaupii]|uniref:Matrilin-1 n=1 Tax=Synaphobranchus kaupii TaxID=118154 RepID=A0A9Q1J526_SYNKA|nr:hypothetical protein SKAU_G00079670 [Synaphobranchus kaupii]
MLNLRLVPTSIEPLKPHCRCSVRTTTLHRQLSARRKTTAPEILATTRRRRSLLFSYRTVATPTRKKKGVLESKQEGVVSLPPHHTRRREIPELISVAHTSPPTQHFTRFAFFASPPLLREPLGKTSSVNRTGRLRLWCSITETRLNHGGDREQRNPILSSAAACETHILSHKAICNQIGCSKALLHRPGGDIERGFKQHGRNGTFFLQVYAAHIVTKCYYVMRLPVDNQDSLDVEKSVSVKLPSYDEALNLSSKPPSPDYQLLVRSWVRASTHTPNSDTDPRLAAILWHLLAMKPNLPSYACLLLLCMLGAHATVELRNAAALAAGLCKTRPTDLVFIVDSSRSVRPSEFEQVKVFLAKVIEGLDVGPNATRVGVVNYASRVKNEVSLKTHRTKAALIKAVTRIEPLSTGTMTGLAIQFAVNVAFSEAEGARVRSPDISKVAIIVTDGRPQDNVRDVAAKARESGIELFAIGVGRVDMSTLKQIASEPEDDHVDYVESYSVIEKLTKKFQEAFCVSDLCATGDHDCEQVCISKPGSYKCACKDGFTLMEDGRSCSACSASATDVVFLIDGSKSVRPENFELVKKWINLIVEKLDVADTKAHVGLVQYSSSVRQEFPLGRFNSKKDLKDAVKKMAYMERGTMTGQALNYILDNSFTPNQGARPGVSKVAIVFTDGRSQDYIGDAAKKAKELGYKMYAVGVGNAVEDELREIASEPIAEHYFYTADFKTMNQIAKKLHVNICEEENPCECESIVKFQKKVGAALQALTKKYILYTTGERPRGGTEAGNRIMKTRIVNRSNLNPILCQNPGDSARMDEDTLLQLLRVSKTCPFPDIRERASELLKTAQDNGVEIPQPLASGPSAFIPTEEILEPGGDQPVLMEAFLSMGRVDHVTMVMALHPAYLSCFLRTQHALLQFDGPLPYHWRHYIVIMAAARHHCSYLVQLHRCAFLQAGGDEAWLQGLHCAPPKLRRLNPVNKLLAHRPWLLSREHIQELVSPGAEDRWSLAELIQAVVLLTHSHSLSSFVWGCGVNPEPDHMAGHAFQPPSPSTRPSHSPAQEAGTNRQGCSDAVTEVEILMKRMQLLQQQEEEFSQEEMVTRFEKERLECLLVMPCDDSPRTPPRQRAPATMRAQDYSWEDHGFSLMNRLYPDMGQLLEEKFQVVLGLTYHTMAMHHGVDTFMLRKAVWNYIHCVYGIRYDDYDYGDVNQLLERSLKVYIKTVACYPEKTTHRMYCSFWRQFRHSEKVHVNLLLLEARLQAALLYALRSIGRYMT